jgi:hypothetical protein
MADARRWLHTLLLPLVALALLAVGNMTAIPCHRAHPAAVVLLAEEEATPAERNTQALRTAARKRAADPLRPLCATGAAPSRTSLEPRSVPLEQRTPGARAPPAVRCA